MKERDGKVDELQKLIDDKTKENQKLLDQVKKADSKKANKSENDKKAQELQATLDNKNEALAKASEDLTLAQKLEKQLKLKVDNEVKEAERLKQELEEKDKQM